VDPIETRTQLLAALEREDPELYTHAPAAGVQGMTQTELGHRSTRGSACGSNRTSSG
jgi:hypothetical protein